MWFVTPSPSDMTIPPTTRYRGVAIAALIVALSPLAGLLGALVTTDRHLVTEDDVVTEDQYVTAVSSLVEGTIDGDLTVFAGSVTIAGTVRGDLNTFSSGTVTITPTGRVEGSLNGAASALSLQGRVGGDIFLAAGSIVIEPRAVVGRDVILFGGSVRVEGTVNRDVRGRSVRLAVDGTVRGDVDVATTILTIGPTARIAGDVLYRSSADADIAEGAAITGTVTKLPAQSNFIYGIILSLANLISFLAFIVAGLVALWLLRGVGSRATGAVLTKPIRSLLVGLAAVVLVPLAVALLAITLVGIPIAIVLVALAVVLFIVGAVPAVTALGNLVLMRRGGLFGAFLVGAVLWRLGIWLIPFVGGAIFVLGMVWGIGGWILGAAAARRSDPTPAILLPASVVAESDAPPEWVPPRAPSPPPDTSHGAADTTPAVVHAPDDPESTDRDDGGASGTEAVADAAPDPSARRDTGSDEQPISFAGSAEGAAVDADDEQGSLDERLAAFRSELESGASEPDEEDDTATRFQALREELASGTVEPPESTSDDDDGGGSPDGDSDDDRGTTGRDWGLPDR